MVKEAEVVDLIHGNPKYEGGLKDTVDAKKGRKQVVVRRKGVVPKKVTVPYELDWERDVYFERMGSYRKAYLIPNSDIPRINPQETIWAKLLGANQDLVAELEKKLDRKDKKIASLKKQLRRYEQEEAEQQKGEQKQGPQYRECARCGKQATVSSWEENDDTCPHCDQSTEGELV